MAREIILDNAKLQSLAANSEINAAFPDCFAKMSVQVTKASCGRCGRAAQSQSTRSLNIGHTKQCIAALSSSSKSKLKRMLGATRLSFTYIKPNRVKVTVTF